ncbi:ATP-binding protein [Streptomyces sp. NPDC059506]|uniref:ATP-binding protein n=1 Tax=Streptomyces sp. NPDC059506 TaxID=3347751 RepID=UPI0036C153E0
MGYQGHNTETHHSYSLFSPGIATAPKVSRDFVRSVLGASGLGHLVDAALLCTSELVTNAYLHASGDIMVRLGLRADAVRISVYDRSLEMPVPRCPPSSDQHGRGLQLVSCTADRWGVTGGQLSEQLKGVWFELGTGTDADTGTGAGAGAGGHRPEAAASSV